MNPLLELRILSELTQQQVAVLTGTSQQFVQRLEQGASAHVAASIANFYDRTVNIQTRRNLLADLLGEYGVTDQMLVTAIPTTSNLYRIYTYLARRNLPDGLDLLVESTNESFQKSAPGKKESVAQNRHNRSVAQHFVEDAYELLVGEELAAAARKNEMPLSSKIQYVAQAIKVHPFVLERFCRFGATVVPPSVTTAIYKGALNVL